MSVQIPVKGMSGIRSSVKSMLQPSGLQTVPTAADIDRHLLRLHRSIRRQAMSWHPFLRKHSQLA